MSTTHAAPATPAEADALRAYVPTQTLHAIAELSKSESIECEKRRKDYYDAKKAIDDAKERMRKDRALIKAMEAKRKPYLSTPMYQRTDAARDAAWQAARIARDAAIAAGESPKFETLAECSARVEGGK